MTRKFPTSPPAAALAEPLPAADYPALLVHPAAGLPQPDGGTAASAAQRFSECLLASNSATATLLDWCQRRRLSQGPITVTKLAAPEAAAPGDDVLERLRLRPGEAIVHRRVALCRGGLRLAVADNWFVATRLPPAMRVCLSTTDTPFGTVIAPLRPQRLTFAVRFLHDESHATARLSHDTPALEHRALLVDRDLRQLAVVHERFLAVLL
jgi:hypothetical protein